MSTPPHVTPGTHGMPGAKSQAPETEIAPHGSLGGYLTGFVMSAILTAIPFWVVMDPSVLASPAWTGAVVVACAAVQIVVHMIFFLHMSPKAEGGWTVMALGFTLVVLVVTLSGTLWVMHHLEDNMMPIQESVM